MWKASYIWQKWESISWERSWRGLQNDVSVHYFLFHHVVSLVPSYLCLRIANNLTYFVFFSPDVFEAYNGDQGILRFILLLMNWKVKISGELKFPSLKVLFCLFIISCKKRPTLANFPLYLLQYKSSSCSNPLAIRFLSYIHDMRKSDYVMIWPLWRNLFTIFGKKILILTPVM